MSTYLKFIISIGAVMYIGKNIHKKTIKRIFNYQKVYCYRCFVDSVSGEKFWKEFRKELY